LTIFTKPSDAATALCPIEKRILFKQGVENEKIKGWKAFHT